MEQCKYCPPKHTDPRKSFDTDRGYCALYVDKNTQKASVRIFSYLSDDSYFETEFEVFYCPMCGRKLFEEQTDE